MEQNYEFDILILGGGHAGVEAGWISSHFKLKVGLVTIPGVSLASAPCNPAIGGVGKGQVVRELDALGGLMPRLADLAGIQYRILNESKGYAVQSTRVQIDKEKYSQYAELIIKESSIYVIRDRVDLIEKDEEHFTLKGQNAVYKSKKLVVTTGTFLNGKIHLGGEIGKGGRFYSEGSVGMESLFKNIKTLKKRFKTGTPPRILKRSINFKKMEAQPSDTKAMNFHFGYDSNKRNLEQVDCFLTRTNEKTLGLIRNNKEKSPIFNGQIEGVGPRYCPSIEDKAFRYPSRNTHHVFVEPEGLDIETFYPNGISTSLPRDIQEEFLRTIPGLENAEIEVYGYAVEYDVIDTLQLNRLLEYRDIPGLYFAGQVCGTSGYEEAAGQGFVAGLNAALSALGRLPFILPREKSYIGVMVDDLCTNERDEPYRLFTARSENRLYIREDNAIVRLSEYRRQLKLNTDTDSYNKKFLKQHNLLKGVIKNVFYLPNDETRDLFSEYKSIEIKEKTSLFEVLQRSEIDPVAVLTYILKKSGLSISEPVVRSVAISTKYSGYIEREKDVNKSLERLENKQIKYEEIVRINNLSFECRQRIEKVKPETFGQLKRIEGIRPATLAFVAASL